MSRGVVLFDHLFHRNMSPVHVAKWRIPRLVTRTRRLPTFALWWMPSEVECTTAKRILAVTAVLV